MYQCSSPPCILEIGIVLSCYDRKGRDPRNVRARSCVGGESASAAALMRSGGAATPRIGGRRTHPNGRNVAHLRTELGGLILAKRRDHEIASPHVSPK